MPLPLVPIVVGGGIAYLVYKTMSDKAGDKAAGKPGLVSNPDVKAGANSSVSGPDPKDADDPRWGEDTFEIMHPDGSVWDTRTGQLIEPAPGTDPVVGGMTKQPLAPADRSASEGLSGRTASISGITAPAGGGGEVTIVAGGESKSPVVQQDRLSSGTRGLFSSLRF